jgi:hypothetical protein
MTNAVMESMCLKRLQKAIVEVVGVMVLNEVDCGWSVEGQIAILMEAVPIVKAKMEELK